MRKYLNYFMSLFIVVSFGLATAGTMSELQDYTAIADSKEDAGALTRPMICPADPSWIGYEVRYKGEVRLYIYNKDSKDKRQLDPSGTTDEFADDSYTEAVVNRDLAWNPVKSSSGDTWAAFVSKASGSAELYLYNVNTNKYFILKRGDDTLSMESRSVSRPSWSPDGKCLTYTASSGGDQDIYIIRGMDWVIKNPDHEQVAWRHEAIMSSEDSKGLQFGAAWCPIPNSGLIAYNHQEEGRSKFEIRIYDPQAGKSFTLSDVDSDLDYFGPSWNASGKRIAYYQYDGAFTRGGQPTGDKFGLGISRISIFEDSVIISPQAGGIRGRAKVLDVAPNMDFFQGPAWLPGGRFLMVSMYDEKIHNPISMVSLSDWEVGGMPKSSWLGTLAGGEFDFPRDINIAGRNITFSYGGAQKRYLLAGELADKSEFAPPLTNLEVDSKRSDWWKRYSEYKKPKKGGFLGFLMSPIAGPDFGLNRWIVPIAVASGLVVYGLTSSDDETTTITSGHDFGAPSFPPRSKSARIGFGINVGL